MLQTLGLRVEQGKLEQLLTEGVTEAREQKAMDWLKAGLADGSFVKYLVPTEAWVRCPHCGGVFDYSAYMQES
jgi:hypothetical protein